MKKHLTLLTALVFSSVALTLAQTSFAASSNIKISLNHAYPKTNGTYTVVVKDIPGVRLALYVNDKNPTYATVNKKDWATFRGVRLAGHGKISFGRVFNAGGKSYQKPVNYIRYFNVADNNTVALLATNPDKVTVPTPQTTTTTKSAVKAANTPASTSVPEPQPTCTNGTYTNSVGNTVCSPETAPSVPAGATAQCTDGSYSFSQSHSGTCSHHGGVSRWL